MNICIDAFSFFLAATLNLNQAMVPIGNVAYGFVGQALLKQRYIKLF